MSRSDARKDRHPRGKRPPADRNPRVLQPARRSPEPARDLERSQPDPAASWTVLGRRGGRRITGEAEAGRRGGTRGAPPGRPVVWEPAEASRFASRRAFRLPDSRGVHRLLGLLSLFLVVALGLTLFLTSSTFGVREILVAGSVHLSSEEILRLCDVELGLNIMKVETGAIRQRLLGNPRIAEATVSRKLPSRLVVRVVEREGVLLLPSGQQFAEVDLSGLPVEFHRYVGALGLPVVTGVTVAGVTLGTKLTEAGLTGALTCAAALGSAGRPAVAEIHVAETGELTLYTRDGLPVYVGEAADLEAKVGALMGILADIEAEGLDVTYVDVRYPRYPVVGSTGGGSQPGEWADPDVFPVFGEP